MSVLNDLVRSRRSIRKYRPDPPPEAWIEDLIRCAMCAPSPMNRQPVRFIRLRSAAVRETLRESMTVARDRLLEEALQRQSPKKIRNWIQAYWRYSEFVFQAPVLLAIGTCRRTSGFSDLLVQAGLRPQNLRTETDDDITVGLAVKGLLLRAAELGLGSCILTAPLTLVSDIGCVLAQDDIELKCFVTVGFPDEKPAWINKKDFEEVYREL